MIRFKLNSPYKSITENIEGEFPNLTIITGLNGTGKTQLLEALARNNQGMIVFDVEKESEIKKTKLVHGTNFTPNNIGASTYDSVSQLYIEMEQSLQALKSELARNMTKEPIEAAKQTGTPYAEQLINISEKSGIDIQHLSMHEIKKYTDPRITANRNDIFQNNLAHLYKSYHLKKIDNDYNKYINDTGEPTKYLSEEEFISINGPTPWTLINSILEESSLPYETNHPVGRERESIFKFELRNKKTGSLVNFNDLSSGEKVLISIAISLYNSKTDMDFPELLLLDEPDAHLHPKMIEKFLRVIEHNFVREKKIKTIMTTHSPTTIALAEEESIFLMGETPPRITKVSKDTALSTLTSGIPTLSVKNENRKQVFVESKYDAEFLEKIYYKHRETSKSPFILNFICASKNGSSSCDEAKSVARKLYEMGTRGIYGLIDWDAKNTPQDNIYILGNMNRYSIENYIFDPIATSLYLICRNYKSPEEFGLDKSNNYFEAPGMESSKIQGIADSFFKIISPHFEQESRTTKTYKLKNGKEIEIPEWYMTHNGHKLEEKLKEVFKPFRDYKTNSAELKRSIITMIFERLPDITPQEIYDTFSDVEEGA